MKTPSKTTFRSIQWLALGGLALTLAGCGAAPDREPRVFRYHFERTPVTLDPALSGDTSSSGVIDRLFDGLMKLDRSTDQPALALAESYSVSEDGLVYTFQLVPGAHFHIGRSIRASDFKKSWQRLLVPGRNSPNARLFELIEGAEAFRTGQAETVAGIEVEDPYLLRLRLRQPFPPFLYHLTAPGASVVPLEEVQRLGDEFGRRPVGSGPFQFHSWEKDQVILDAFEDHLRPPQISRLIYKIADAVEALRLYQANELDLVTAIPSGTEANLRQTFSAGVRAFASTFWWGFCFRCDREPFTDARVRRAFARAVDRDALVRQLGTSRHIASAGFIPQGIPGHQAETLIRGVDLKIARQLLRDAGFPEGLGFPELIYSFRENSEFGDMTASSITEGLSDLGIRLGRKPLGWERFLESQRGGLLALFSWRWGGEYPDPEPYLRPLFHSRGSSNLTAYGNPEVDRLLDEAQVERDPARRLELYRQTEQLIIEDAPCVGLFQRSEMVLLRPGWQGIPVGFDRDYFEIELARWAGD